ncbi:MULTISPECIES: hypothetical protein [Streptomyces]|uniref:hypothetical protein n=1 Tax=Streptomyces TaxID=1883 RepID=UPI0006901E28|nr:hypothetical protein [Streptomyces durhamensis]
MSSFRERARAGIMAISFARTHGLVSLTGVRSRTPSGRIREMSVVGKLQIKPGQSVVVLGKPDDVHLEVEAAGEAASADVVLAFVTSSGDLPGEGAQAALAAARRDALAWVAYPKGGRLGTDLNRDTLAAALSEQGVRPVRQVAIDDTWSALRFRPGI